MARTETLAGDLQPPPPVRRSHETPFVIGAAMLIGIAALQMLAVEPILLGSLAAAGRLTEAQLGQASMVEVLGLALGAAFGPVFMQAGHMRAKAGFFSLALAAVDFAIGLVHGPVDVLVQRAVAGVLEGMMLGSVNLILTHTARPERMSGIFMAVSGVPQISAAYLLPVFVIPRFGFYAGFITLAVLAAAAAIVSPLLVQKVEIDHEIGGRRAALTAPLICFAGAIFLQSAGIGAAWNYIERLADQRHFSGQVVGAAVAGSLILQMIGVSLAAWLSWRLPARPIIILAVLLEALTVFLMTSVYQAAAFVAICGLFGVFWIAVQPFQVTELIRLDPSRKIAVLFLPIGLIGLSIGPLVSSFAVKTGDVVAGYYVAVAMLVTAGAFYIVSAGLSRRLPP